MTPGRAEAMTHDRADIAAAEGIALALLLRQLDGADWDRCGRCGT